MAIQIILIANPKGGAGKTTVATNLAAALAASGAVTLADADRQRSALGWLGRRPGRAPGIAALDWSKDAGRPPGKGDHLVIDAPAALRTGAFEDLLALADIVLVPVQPSTFDQAATLRFLERVDALKPVRKGKVPVGLIANRLRQRSLAAARLETALAGEGRAVVARLRDSARYAEVAAEGLGIADLPARRQGTLGEDWAPLLAFLKAAEA